MAKKCYICEKHIGMLDSRISLTDGIICNDCWNKAGFTTSISDLQDGKRHSCEDIRHFIESGEIIHRREQLKNEMDAFTPTKEIRKISFDDKNRALMIYKMLSGPSLYHYDEILSFELLEDNTCVTKGGIGSAVVGGLLFGGIGAVIGAATGSKKTKNVCDSLAVKITFKNEMDSVEFIKLITSTTKKKSLTYKYAMDDAQKIMSALQIAVDMVNEKKEELKEQIQPAISAADEILKFKNLLDAGIITEEEFAAKKKQLLGL